jgi:polar amino acid transport system substrate-binding protein
MDDMRLAISALVATLFAGLPAFAQDPVAREFAPTGSLRAVINFGNPVLATRGEGGAPRGVSVDLANELGRRLGVPVVLVTVEAAGRAVDIIRAGDVDVGFFAIDPARSAGIAFSAPYIAIEGAYLVRESSPVRAMADVDRAGARIAVGLGSAYDLFLTREIKAATLVRAPTSPAVVPFFLENGLEVAAGVRQQLESDAARTPGLRILPGNFMTIEQAMGTPSAKGPAVAAYLRDFVETMKREGFVAAAVARHGVQGVTLVPPGAR